MSEAQPSEAPAVGHWERVFADRAARTGEPAWLATRRAEAFAAFAATGFPRPKAPGWRHTNIAPLGRVPFAIDGAHGPIGDLPELEGACGRVVFVDGHFHAGLSTLPFEAGLAVSSLRDELAAGAADVRGALRAESEPNGPFTALNLALAEDGAVVRVGAKAAVAGPLHLVFLATKNPGPLAAHVRSLVLVGSLAEVTVVEHYLGPDDAEYLVNAVTDVVAGPGSRVVHARLQEEGSGAWHVADVRARLDRDARLSSLSVALGSKLSRTGLHAVLAGEGAECDLIGLYFGRDRQHQDHTTLVEHEAPHGTSRERYKGILDDASRGVFAGLVRVAPGAVKTDASQDNRNLVLSDKAHADSEPMLEIHTDDLKASHGSAIGRLDDDALFYLRARGLDAAEARRLLTRAFAADVLDGLPHAGLAALVAGRVGAWLTADLGGAA